MARGRRNNRLPVKKTKRRYNRSQRRNTVIRAGGVTSQLPFLTYLRFVRTAISMLPTSTATGLIKLLDFAFDLIANVIAEKNYYTGAQSVIGVSPAALLSNSPLLAKVQNGYSFPGFPVSVTYISFRIKNTTKLSEHSGRWAAVFIPYREVHDASHYKKLMNITYPELCAMPYSKSGAATTDLIITYRMRDKTNYCARPREITEEIGLLTVVWDSTARDGQLVTKAFTNNDFNCEIEIVGGCRPHVIFGPQHRNTYNETQFALRSITSGKEVRLHHENGHIERVNLLKLQPIACPDYEML